MMRKSKFISVLSAAVLAISIAVASPSLDILPQAAVTSYADTAKLSAPTNFKASVTETTVSLSWDAVYGADAYRVFMYDNTTNTFEICKNVAGNSCLIKDLKSSTTYILKVSALVKSGNKYVAQKTSSKITVKTSEPKLPAPASVSVSSDSSSISLSWSEVAGASAYRVYMQNNNTGEYEVYKNFALPSCKISGLNSDTMYNFKLAALVNNNGKYKEQTQTNGFTVKTAAKKAVAAPTGTTSATKSSTPSASSNVSPSNITSSSNSIPAGNRYVLNTNTMKIHLSECRFVDKIADENYATTSDYQWALTNGYVPCKVCHP